MKKRKQTRLLLIAGLVVISFTGVYLILSNLEDNIVFFYPPSATEKIAGARTKIRIGGVVEENSVIILGPDKIRFRVTDYKKSITVEYTGMLPALFREKQGIIAEGNLDRDVFISRKLLAKHDENYMPPEISRNLTN